MNDLTRKNEIFLLEKDPMGVAATILYISCLEAGEKINQEYIANAAGITGATLRNRFKALKSQLYLS
jgi:transcription initiation factor TFIIB